MESKYTVESREIVEDEKKKGKTFPNFVSSNEKERILLGISNGRRRVARLDQIFRVIREAARSSQTKRKVKGPLLTPS